MNWHVKATLQSTFRNAMLFTANLNKQKREAHPLCQTGLQKYFILRTAFIRKLVWTGRCSQPLSLGTQRPTCQAIPHAITASHLRIIFYTEKWCGIPRGWTTSIRFSTGGGIILFATRPHNHRAYSTSYPVSSVGTDCPRKRGRSHM